MPKRFDQTTNATAVAAADQIPFITAAGVTSYATGDEFAASGPFSSRYAPLPGQWTAWTPTITSSSGTITTVGSVGGRYVEMGKLVTCTFSVQITTKGTATGFVLLTLPVTRRSTVTNGTCGSYREINNDGQAGMVLIVGTSSQVGLLRNDGNTSFVNDGNTYVGTFTYEAA